MLFGACRPQPSVYIPNAPQIPLLARAGELRAALSGDLGMNTTANSDKYVSAKAAYALSDRLGLMMDLAYNPRTSDSTNTAFLYAEAGAGIHKKIGEYGRLEAYAGIGFGHLHSRLLQLDDVYGGMWSPAAQQDTIFGGSPDFVEKDANFTKPFLQLSLGAEGDVIAVAFSLRLSYLALTHLHSDSTSWDYAYTSPSRDESFRFNVLKSQQSLKYHGLFIEPAMMLRLGYQRLKVEQEIWWSYPFKDPPFLWASANLSLGISFDLDP